MATVIAVVLAASAPFPGGWATADARTVAPVQESREEVDPAVPDGGFDWPSPWISEIPTVDLSGTWRFLPGQSDPMVEAWRGREIHYRIEQQPEHVVLEFAPRDEDPTTQVYRWDGTIRRDRRGRAQIAERARWRDGGRILEIHGRYWIPGVEEDPHHYRFRYALRGGVLTFTQTDDTGTTTWRFEQVAGDGGVP